MKRSALITGAVGGIGREISRIALPLYDELHLLDIDGTRLEAFATSLRHEFPASAIHTHKESVESQAAIENVFMAIGSSPGSSLTAVFHCAAILRGNSGMVSAIDLPESEWESIIDINLTGSFIVAKAAIRSYMSNKQKGDIILIGSSTAAHPRAYDAAYAASKAGVIALADSLNDEVMRLGIRVQCISPDAVDTEIWSQNDGILPRPPHMIKPSTVADLAIRMVGLPRDAFLRNVQVLPYIHRRRKP